MSFNGGRPITLVVYVTPPDRRGTIVTHGFHLPEELDRERTKHTGAVNDVQPVRQPSNLEAKLQEALDEIVKLKDRVALLECRVQH